MVEFFSAIFFSLETGLSFCHFYVDDDDAFATWYTNAFYDLLAEKWLAKSNIAIEILFSSFKHLNSCYNVEIDLHYHLHRCNEEKQMAKSWPKLVLLWDLNEQWSTYMNSTFWPMHFVCEQKAMTAKMLIKSCWASAKRTQTLKVSYVVTNNLLVQTKGKSWNVINGRECVLSMIQGTKWELNVCANTRTTPYANNQSTGRPNLMIEIRNRREKKIKWIQMKRLSHTFEYVSNSCNELIKRVAHG